MKVRLDIDKSLKEDEIIIKSSNINNVNLIHKRILNITALTPNIVFYKNNKEYYLETKDVIFFETEDSNTYAHTKDETFLVKYRLYELEDILSKNFVRISKSTIVNINHILSISTSFGSSYSIEFNKSHKQVYVSRRYLKILRYGLEERRNYES